MGLVPGVWQEMRPIRVNNTAIITLGGALGILAVIAVGLAMAQQILLSASNGPFMGSLRALYSETVRDHAAFLGPLISFKGSFGKGVFLGVVTILPLLFLGHFVLIGPKSFSHAKGKVLFFGAVTRFIHWVVAFSFTVLVITGLMVVFAKALGGGAMVLQARHFHVAAALVFSIFAVPMFLIWIKDMLPAPYDIEWLLMIGGYLSKEKRPIPAGKFNAGQKTWFWLATLGGAVMAWTGWYIYGLGATTRELRLYVLIHGYLAAVLVGFFIIHLYMSLFAIKGALGSMLTGYKPKEEVEILHSRYRVR